MRTRSKLAALLVPLVAAAALTATTFDATADEPPRATAAATPTTRVTYETGTLDSGFAALGLDNQCCPGVSLRVTDLARTGGHAVRSDLRYGDPMVKGGTRAESHTIKMPSTLFGSGMSAYYGFSVYIPSTWRADDREDILFQWHNWPDACESGKVPSAFLSVQPSGKWRLRVNSDAASCSTADSITKTSADLADVKLGEWNDFVFRFDWDHDADGRVQAWHQSSKRLGWRQVLDKQGANTFNDVGPRGYLKWGVYKPAWNTAPTSVDRRVVVHDNIAVGSSFAAVDPSVG
ncbi:MAG TPA: polysaccharide lyase [Phytomonospora sp.]